MSDLHEMCFAQWPADRQRPTAPQIAAAQMRYDVTCNPQDASDYGCGLGFVMATYSRFVWWPFFFPEDEEGREFAHQEAKMAALTRFGHER